MKEKIFNIKNFLSKEEVKEFEKIQAWLDEISKSFQTQTSFETMYTKNILISVAAIGYWQLDSYKHINKSFFNKRVILNFKRKIYSIQ